MKFNPLIIIITLFLLFACNNDKKKDKDNPGATTEASKEEASELQKKLDTLQQLTPYSPEQMESMIPAILDDDTAMHISGRNNMGTGYASADYKISDSTSLELGVFDCAGNAGAGIYNAQFAGLMDSNIDTETEYTKIIDFKGGKAIEHGDKRWNNSSLIYIANDRLLVTMEGKNISTEELKKIAAGLKLNKE